MLRRLISFVDNSTLPLRKELIRRTFAIQKKTEENVQNSDDILVRYTTAEREKILQLVNSLKLQEILSYGITKGRANKLIAWKNHNGSLRTIQDIFLVDGFSLKTVDKFYQSLLQQPANKAVKKPARSRLGSFLTPALDADQRELIRSCVSLRIGVSSVSWARLELTAPEHNAPCQLTHWQHHEICEKKLHLNDLVQRCLYVDHMIPSADCYIFENPQMAQVSTNPGSAEQQNISVQKAQIVAILSYAVARRSYSVNTTNTTNTTDVKALKGSQVYYLRRFLTARLFKHLVGTERVSSEETVLKLMRTDYNIPGEQDIMLDGAEFSRNSSEPTEIDNNSADPDGSSSDVSLRGHVQFNNKQRQMFAHAQRYHREFLGQALLLNLTFVRLALLQDSQSVAAVSRQSNKDREVNVEEIFERGV